jgi:hypothetical protein
MDANIPGGIHLCQVNETISCAACCGVYNVRGATKQALQNRLMERTERFSEIPRNMEAILAFGREFQQRRPEKSPFPEFHSCPYVGFIGESRSRVGCMLHPAAVGNNGVDFRGLSYYGGMACHTYFCPSHGALPPVVKLSVQNAADDWYLYGLVITETELLKSFFEELEKRIHQPLNPDKFTNNKRFLKAVHEFMQLKLHWPYRPQPDPGPCNYFFKDQCHKKPKLEINDDEKDPVRYAALYRELVTRFQTKNERYHADSLIDDIFKRMDS